MGRGARGCGDTAPPRGRGDTVPRASGADGAGGQGGVLGIKIGWVCDLDRAWERCLPRYSFTRLDGLARAPAHGYNFR